MQKMPPSSWGKLGESKGGSTPPPPPKSDPSPPPSGGGGDSPPPDEDPDTIVTPWGTSFKAKKNLKDPTEPLFSVESSEKNGKNIAAPEELD